MEGKLIMPKLFLELNRCFAALSTKVGTALRTRKTLEVQQSKQIAQLYYRVEQLSQDSDAIKSEQSERWASLIQEKLASAESEKLKYAVIAAKEGASSQVIADKYGLFDAEAELIVSVHGTHGVPPTRKLH